VVGLVPLIPFLFVMLVSCPLVPPYGAEAADLQTIFGVKHLKKQAYFLDTQCSQLFSHITLSHTDDIASDRLPVPLGEFISETVYNGKLRSCHEVVDHSCIAFIDVWKGEERKRAISYEVSVRARCRVVPKLMTMGD
jgi:hypothetical protein